MLTNKKFSLFVCLLSLINKTKMFLLDYSVISSCSPVQSAVVLQTPPVLNSAVLTVSAAGPVFTRVLLWVCPQTGSPDPAQRSHRPRGVLQGACCHRLRQAAPGPGLSHLELWITDQHVNIGSPAAGAPGRKKQIQSLQVFFCFFLSSSCIAKSWPMSWCRF